MCSIKIVSTGSTLLKYRLKKRNHIKWCEFQSQKNLQRKENKIKIFQKFKCQCLNVKYHIKQLQKIKLREHYFYKNFTILTEQKEIAKTWNNLFTDVIKIIKSYKNFNLPDINIVTSNFSNHISVQLESPSKL